MKILVVCDVLGQKNNGTTMAAYNFIDAMKKRGHEVRILCSDEDKRGLPGYYICKTLKFGPFINKYLDKNGIQLAKVNTKIVKEAMDGVDLVHCLLPFALGCKAAKIANEKHIPITASLHVQAENVTSHFGVMKLSRLNPHIYRVFWHNMFKYVDCIHFPTKFIKDDLEKAIGPTNGYVISNGVKSFFQRKEIKKPENLKDKFTILYTGRYSKEKKQKLLIDAVKKSKYKDKIQIIFAGNGPLYKKIKKWGRKLKNKPILGIYTQDKLLDVINSADLYVHCAYAELESIACLEAINCGLVPVINNTKRVATKYFAIDDKNLFKCNNTTDLAKKIDYWIEHPEERKKRSDEYLNFTKQFEFEHCFDRMEKMLYEAVEVRKYKTEHNYVNRVVTYCDPLNEDYACTDIRQKPLTKDFKYINKNIFWRFISNFIYFCIAKPIVWCAAKIRRSVRIKNKKALKKVRKTGYFLYGNHTSRYDAVIPQSCITGRKTYILANPDAVSIKGIKSLVMMLGSLPVPTSLQTFLNFEKAIEYRINQKSAICIYPEAHIWPYCEMIRPFADASFVYPAKLNVPVVAFVSTFRKQKFNASYHRKPKITIKLSEPFYPDPTLTVKENRKYLRDQVYEWMKEECKNSNKVDFIHYIPCAKNSARFEK